MHDPAEWLADWLQTDMGGDDVGIAAFAAGLQGGPIPDCRLGNLYAASIRDGDLWLENLMQEEWPPVRIPAAMVLAAINA